MRPIFTDKTHNKNSERKPINTTIQLPHMSAINLTLLHCIIGNFGLFSKSLCPLNTDGFASSLLFP